MSSLPYHHPFILADRMVLLDHLTRGRVMFGVGPGALPSDAFMMGIDPMNQRDMMEESLEAILALLDGGEPVTREASWFTLRNARLQLRPYTHPRFEVAVAAQISPAGPRAAGRFGLSLLSIGATIRRAASTCSARTGRSWRSAPPSSAPTVDRRKWRLVGPMHIAETEEQARADVKFGLAQWVDYFERVAALPLAPGTLDPDKMVDALMETGFAVVGHPGDGHRPDRAAHRAVRAASAPTSSWPTSGPTARRRCSPTSCSPARSMPHFKGTLAVAARARGTGRRRTGPSSSAPWAAPSCRPSRTITPSARPSSRRWDHRVLTVPATQRPVAGVSGRASKVGTRCRAARASSTRRTGVGAGPRRRARAPSGVRGLGHDALQGARPGPRGSGGSRSRWARS